MGRPLSSFKMIIGLLLLMLLLGGWSYSPIGQTRPAPAQQGGCLNCPPFPPPRYPPFPPPPYRFPPSPSFYPGYPPAYYWDNSAAAPTTTQPPNNLVVLWNEVMLAAIRNGPPRPTVTARSLYMVHAAMYDAWSAYDPFATPIALDPIHRRPVAEHTPANKAEAVSQATYHMLVHFFPGYEQNSQAFSRLLANLGYEVVTSDDNSPASVGLLAAQAIIASRQNDGANEANNYADITSAIYPQLYAPVNSANPQDNNGPGRPGFDLNHWQPLRVPTGTRLNTNGEPIVDDNDPTSYKEQTFLTPQWGVVIPFVLASGNQLQPPAPPRAGSNEPYTDALGQTMTNDQAYQLQYDQVLEFSANLNDEWKCIAEYWADGPRSETPPGHWNALAHGISERDNHTIDDDVKLYLALNGALFDASIAAWDAKRTYDSTRPVSAIRYKYAGQMINAWAGPGQGTQPIPGENWRPYQELTFLTPPFAEFVSGHSTFSAAAAEVLTLFTGSNQFYDGVTMLNEDFNRDGVPDMLGQHIMPVKSNMFKDTPSTVVVLQWETFQEAAEEAGISRLYGGIHIQDANLHGQSMGKKIGQEAYTLAKKYWNGAR
jgi:hypothetical protein